MALYVGWEGETAGSVFFPEEITLKLGLSQAPATDRREAAGLRDDWGRLRRGGEESPVRREIFLENKTMKTKSENDNELR
jgi:hypothetical protein